jgi:hypothetical protein
MQPEINCMPPFNHKAAELMNGFKIMPNSTIVIIDKQGKEIIIDGYKGQCIEAVIMHLYELNNINSQWK